MHKLVLYFSRRILPTLNPLRPLGMSVQVKSRWSLSRSRQIRLAILLYALSLVLIFLFFREYALDLSTKKLLTTSSLVIAKTLILPVAYFSLSIYFLTLGMALARTIIPIYLMPIVYIASLNISTNALISSGIVLFSYLLFYFMFSISIGEFKVATLTKALTSSLSMFSLVLSFAITISLYGGFSNRADSIGNKLGNTVTDRFSFIFNINTPAEEAILKRETLQSFSIKYLQSHNTSVTQATIKAEEQSVVTGLGLKFASSSDTMANLKRKAVTTQVTSIINTYHKLIQIAVPFAFFFITQSLTSVAAIVVVGVMFFTERVLNIKKVQQSPRDSL